jgi:hypothetical protein
MIEWEVPAWIAAAALAPVLAWWLHPRHQAPRQVVPALYPWRGAAAPVPVSEVRGSRDRRWILRALLLAALALALARPSLSGGGEGGLQVWLDDAPSLWARDAGRSRLQQGATALRDALAADLPGATVSLRRLRRIGSAVVLGPGDDVSAALTALVADDDGTLSPTRALPPPVMLDPDRQHWLITDGADPALSTWTAAAPLARVLQVGGGGLNAGISALAARRAGQDDPDRRVRVLARVHNASPLSLSRVLVLRSGSSEVMRRALVLQPGEQRSVLIRVSPSPGERLLARLLPADADGFAADDSLALDLTPLVPVALKITGSCGSDLGRVLRHHPGVRSTQGEADLQVVCQPTAPTGEGPVLLFRTGAARRLDGAESLRRAAAALRRGLPPLEPAGLAVVVVDPGPADAAEVLLSAGDVPLVLRQGRRRLEVRLLVSEPSLGQRRAYPALVSALLELSLGRPLLDPQPAAEAPEVAIAPRSLMTAGAGAEPPGEAGASRRRPLWPLLVTLAAVLVLLDLLTMLGLPLRRLARPPGGAP